MKTVKLPKKSFAAELDSKLSKSGLGIVHTGTLSDNSGSWVNLRVGERELSFSFTVDGKSLNRIGLYKDVIEVTDSLQEWGVDSKKLKS